jgi:DNA polymerase III sliding clamp (beta) subunit (PCNA family)
MKPIPLPIAELKNALTGFGKVLPKRVTLPVLGMIKLERTSDGWVALTATDLDAFATVRLEQPTDGEPTSLLVPYDELLKTSKLCGKNDTLLLRSDEHQPTKAGVISYAVGDQVVGRPYETLPLKEFPPVPKIKGDAVVLPSDVRTSIHEAFECASTDVTRYVINGAYLDLTRDDGHYVVATDGHQLYSSHSFKLPLAESLIIPTHRFLGWKEFHQDGDWQLKIGTAEKKEEAAPFQLTSRRWRFISRQREGNYPNWRQVVPSADAFSVAVELDPESLAGVVHTIDRMPCHNASHMTIGLQIAAKRVSLLGKPPGAEQWTKVELREAKVLGADATVYLDRRYLAKALRFGLNRRPHFPHPWPEHPDCHPAQYRDEKERAARLQSAELQDLSAAGAGPRSPAVL